MITNWTFFGVKTWWDYNFWVGSVWLIVKAKEGTYYFPLYFWDTYIKSFGYLLTRSMLKKLIKFYQTNIITLGMRLLGSLWQLHAIRVHRTQRIIKMWTLQSTMNVWCHFNWSHSQLGKFERRWELSDQIIANIYLWILWSYFKTR